jgi:hypothetical protein
LRENFKTARQYYGQSYVRNILTDFQDFLPCKAIEAQAAPGKEVINAFPD